MHMSQIRKLNHVHSESYMLKIIVENLVGFCSIYARSMLGLCSVYDRFMLLALHAPHFSPIDTSQIIDISFFWQLRFLPLATPIYAQKQLWQLQNHRLGLQNQPSVTPLVTPTPPSVTPTPPSVTPKSTFGNSDISLL